MEPLPQVTEVKPVQLPEKSCSRELAGAEDKLMVGLTDFASNRYHTSLREGAPQPIIGMAVYVAFVRVPPVTEHAGFEVRVTAFSHRSFTGGSTTQMLNVPVVFGSAYTLT